MTDPILPEALDTPNLTPPGFDPALYLMLNPDVAAAGVDPIRHYSDYGRAELRLILPDGQKLDHPESRLFTTKERNAWQNTLRTLAIVTPLKEIIATHPRADWLYTGFTLAGYLQNHGDVAEAVNDPLEAAFHFLEIGLEDGRLSAPDSWNSEFVATRYGLKIPPKTSMVRTVLAQVLAQGISPLDVVLDEAQLWERAGLYGFELVRLFDHEYYHAICHRDAPEAAPRTHDRVGVIAHFLEQGLDAVRPINPDSTFDPAFYVPQLDDATRETLLPHSLSDNTRLDPMDPDVTAQLYRHWLTRGLRQHKAPNAQIWGLQKFGVKVPRALYEQMPVFGLVAGLEPDGTGYTRLEQFVSKPRPAAAALDLRAHDVADFITTLANRFAVSGKKKTAEWLYMAVLSQDKEHGRARRHLADLMQGEARLETATYLRAGLSAEQGGGWSHLEQAEALLGQQHYRRACDVLTNLPRRFLGDVSIIKKKGQLAREIFYRIWHNLEPHVAAYGAEATQMQLRGALQACTPPFITAERIRPVRRVALIGHEDLAQCKLYRVNQKVDQLRAAGFDVRVFSPSRDLADFTARADEYDAAIFFRVPAFPAMIDAIAAAAQHGLLTFYEIDDVVFDTAHFPPNLESYAGQIDANHHATMACGVLLFEHAMSLCDYGIASTATIARLMEPRVRTGRVFEHHNALGRLHMAALEMPSAPRDTQAPLRLFYASGTKAHKKDFHDILEPALAEILHRHPGRVEVQLVGHFGRFTHLDPATDPVEVREPIWDFDAFCRFVAKADINLSVLSRSLLTDAKSEIKWMEAAMFAIPSVVSDTATYREVIEDGRTGILATDTEGFVRGIDQLVSDAALRKQLGEAARETVLRDYAIARMGRNLHDMFTDLRPEDMHKTRLVVVNVFYPPQAIGGATRVVHDNVRLLREHYGNRYEIDVICTLGGGSEPLSVTTYAEDGVRVWAITVPDQPQGDMTPRDPKVAEVFERLIDRLGPDLIHFHCIQRLTASVVEIARLRKIPYLITLHDGWWVSPNQFIIDEKDRIELYDYRRQDDPDFPQRAMALASPLQGAARLLAVSGCFADLHRDCGLNNIEVTENGVSSLPVCTRQPSPSGRVRLAHIGGVSRHKGIHLVRNALLANSYDNLELLLVDHALSPGTEIHEIWGTVPVIRTAKVPQSDIAALYEGIDILLAPSIWPESYGLVTREALACGVWVITSDRGAIGADIEEGVNGHRVDVSTYEGLAKILWTVDHNPERYLDSPQAWTKPRQADDQVVQLAMIYDAVLSKHGAR